MNIRRIVAFIFLLLMVGSAGGAWSNTVYASPADVLVEKQTERLNTGPVEEYWSKLMTEYGGFFPESQTPSFQDMMRGESFTPKAILNGMLKYVMHEVLVNGKLLASIVVLAIFSIILETIQSAFEKNTVSQVGYAITYIVLIILVINSFGVAIGYAKDAIGNMVGFMMAMIPLLLTLLASMGNMVSVTVLHPLVVFMIHSVGTLIYVVVFPLLFFSAVLHIVSAVSERYKVTQLADLLRNIAVALLGVFVTVFLGVLSIKGATGAVTDGITVRTAKYVASNFVPVVGRLFSDATDTVLGASLLVKNAVGIAGVVMIILMCAFPALKILTLAFIYKVSAAVMQPLGASPISKTLQTIGKSMIYVFAALASVGLMFFLAITIIITASNVSVMVR
jgi:stage III sporulation protein AE